MLAVKTSDQEVTNQRVSFGLENSVYIMHVLHSIARGGVFSGILNSQHWF